MTFQFDHIAQQVDDIASAVNWYIEFIPGARVLYQDDTWAFVEANGVRLAFVTSDQHPDHIAWRVSIEELEALALKTGKEIKIHRDKSKSIYIEGPGGSAVEVISMQGSRWE